MILPGPLHLVRRKWARIIALQFGVMYPFTPKGSSRSAERGEELRQVGDAPPCLPRFYRLDLDLLEVRVEDGGALHGERRRTVVLLLPERMPVCADPRAG